MSDESRSALDPDKIPKRRGLHIREIKEETPEPESTVGTELKAAREAAGKELNDVASALRIKPEHLIALEASEYDKLPAKTYVVGFVRQYAQQLGMDANEMVLRLKRELEGPEPEPETSARGQAEPAPRRGGPAGPLGGVGAGPAASSDDESRLPTTSIVVVVVLLLVVIFGGWYLTRPSGDTAPAPEGESDTGLNAKPQADGATPEKTKQALPEPPVVPASADSGNGSGTAKPGRGSLTALLPGADSLRGSGAAEETVQPRLNMPDAAAAAVPIEEGETAATGTSGGEEAASLRTGEVVENAMPQPKLALRTVKSRLPGVPEDAVEEEEDGEPALEEIEAEGVGGEVETDAAPPESEVRPRPKRLPEETEADESSVAVETPAAGETSVHGDATVNSRVTLRVRSSAWVRVEDADGRVIIERDMGSGDSFRAPNVDGLYLVTKDAGAIEVLVDGESIGRAGRPDQVLTGLLLSPDQLRQRVAQNAPAAPQQ